MYHKTLAKKGILSKIGSSNSNSSGDDVLLPGIKNEDLSITTAKSVEIKHSNDPLPVSTASSAVSEKPATVSHPPVTTTPASVFSAPLLLSPLYQSEVVSAVGSPVNPLASPSPGRRKLLHLYAIELQPTVIYILLAIYL